MFHSEIIPWIKFMSNLIKLQYVYLHFIHFTQVAARQLPVCSVVLCDTGGAERPIQAGLPTFNEPLHLS